MTDPYRTERVRRAYVYVIGPIWMPPITAASTYKLSDFQYVSDFHAVCGSTEIPWIAEESEFKFSDCMYPSD